MKSTFEHSTIGTIKFNNRIIRSATHEGLANTKGHPTSELINKYIALAKGGVGGIITGYAGVMQNGKSPLKNMLMINSDDHIQSYKKLVNDVHEYNTPIILQIAHSGRQTESIATGFPKVAPSAIRDKLYNKTVPEALTEKGIIEIIDAFVDAIVRAKKIGFDGVQLHMAHGYLLSSFLSPNMNRRTDRWGGNHDNRFRIIKEILIKARKLVGDYPILAKINGYETSKKGLTVEDAIINSRCLEEYGCTAIEVSSGIAQEGFTTIRGNIPFEVLAKTHESIKKLPKLLLPLTQKIVELVVQNPKPYHLFNVSAVKRIKEHVSIPVIVVGGIRKIDDINNIIESGVSDYVSMSKPFILEPGIVNKFKAGKQQESKCIECNYCVPAGQFNSLKCYYGKYKA